MRLLSDASCAWEKLLMASSITPATGSKFSRSVYRERESGT